MQGKGVADTLAAVGKSKPPVAPRSGSGKGGGGRDLPGGLTPLLGDRKVEAMYGIKKPSKQ